MKSLFTIILLIFLAELGDKTQLATILYSAESDLSKFYIFVGASLALILSTALCVLCGGMISSLVSERTINLFSGIGFIGVGIWMLLKI